MKTRKERKPRSTAAQDFKRADYLLTMLEDERWTPEQAVKAMQIATMALINGER